MTTEMVKKRYSLGEEIANAITHGIGVELAIAGLVFLLVRAVRFAPAQLRAAYIVGFSVFGATMIVLYLASTLYHALPGPKAKKVFGVFDHSSIYLLIAGTYTAYCLTVLHGALGWLILGVIWGLSVLGITFYAIFGSRMRRFSAISYIPMGLMIVLASGPMQRNLLAISGTNTSWYLLIAGGAFYIVGTAFYAMKKIKWMHSVWHLFVIAGSAFHFFSIYMILA